MSLFTKIFGTHSENELKRIYPIVDAIEALEPDVVLTDIRMPYMDGLTLAERIRQKYPSMKIVIFSGFDDFEYAKQAIKLNVTEYILKPVNVEELTAILKRIKVNLDQEIEQKRNVNLLRENYIRSLPILRENFLNELVSHSMDPAIVESRMREYDLDLLGAKKWIAAAIDIEEPEKERMGQLAIHQEKDLMVRKPKRLWPKVPKQRKMLLKWKRQKRLLLNLTA